MEEKKEENEKTYQLRNEINTLLETGKPITENLFKEYNETIEGPQKKEESSKGKVYRWVKNASAKIKQEVLAKRKSIATAALVSLMGIAVIATPGKEKETNPTFIAQTTTTIDKTIPIEVEVHDEDKNLFNKTCTLKNYNIYAYTDQYVGLDGEPTQRIPLYPPDMPRTILRVFMDVPVQGLIEVHSDEEINYYLEIGGQVRSIYTSDACFYQISDVNMKRTEEMKRWKMKEENLDIIEIEGKEYVLVQKFSLEGKNYFLLNALDNDELQDEAIVLREENGMLYSIEEESEQKQVAHYLTEYTKAA